VNEATAPYRVIDRWDGAALAVHLRHLHAFSAVAAAGSIAQAAEGLVRVPSAVTRSVAQLEATLGRSLFIRSSRGVTLNAQGERVLVRAQRIEREFDELRVQLVARGGLASAADPKPVFMSILNGRRLAVIASLSETRNMPSVARDFGITQPAISVALKDLERGLGVALFERRSGGLVPTVAGELVAFHLKRVLAELRHTVPDLAAGEGVLQGSVHVGAPTLGRLEILPAAIASLLARHPQLHVVVIERPCDALAAPLRNGDIDFTLGVLGSEDEAVHLEQQPLFDDHIAVIARAGHPLVSVPAVGVEALHEATWALPRRGVSSREMLERFFLEAGHTPPMPVVEAGDPAVLCGLLRESDMLTAVSPHRLRSELRDGRLVTLDVPLGRLRRRIGLTQRLGALPSPGARALMQELKNAVARSADFASASQARR
jgi:LysR family transcriptional regulator of gallate degradation